MEILTADELQRLMESDFPDEAVPIVELVTDEGVVVRQAIDERHCRRGGTVSGPTMMTFADIVAGMAIISRTGHVDMATTSLHIDFLRKPALADLLAEASILKLGRRLGVVAVALRSEGSPAIVAEAQVTYSITPVA